MVERPVGIHRLLRDRWSPSSFDPRAELSDNELNALLEAARWSPSAGNSQPWAFAVARRGDDLHHRVVRHLARSSAAWAPDAAVLIVNLCQRYVEGTDWEYSEFSVYDLGQAVAQMTVQATSMDLTARQFRAFDKEALSVELEVPAHWELITIMAVGTALVRQESLRDRRPLDDLVWPHRRKAAEVDIAVP